MTVKERLEDISKRCGMSEDIVRRVLDAEKKSIIDSLKRGERATLIGRCVIIPELRSRLGVGCTMEKKIKLSATVTSSLASEFKDLGNFETNINNEESIPEGVMMMQLSSLT